MNKANLTTMLMGLLISASVWATPAVRYTGNFSITAGGAHNTTITGNLSLTFDGDQLALVNLKTAKPVMGQTDFVSKEQYAFSKVAADGSSQVAVVYKLKGAPHVWFYVLVVNSADQGKTFAGTYYKGDKSLNDIKAALDAGTIGSFKKVGTGALTAIAGLE